MHSITSKVFHLKVRKKLKKLIFDNIHYCNSTKSGNNYSTKKKEIKSLKTKFCK